MQETQLKSVIMLLASALIAAARTVANVAGKVAMENVAAIKLNAAQRINPAAQKALRLLPLQLRALIKTLRAVKKIPTQRQPALQPLMVENAARKKSRH